MTTHRTTTLIQHRNNVNSNIKSEINRGNLYGNFSLRNEVIRQVFVLMDNNYGSIIVW